MHGTEREMRKNHQMCVICMLVVSVGAKRERQG
jgi:hypothetical protein